jgi:hypothetical protein
MGTSKAYGGIKGNPNWTKLSSSVTRACNTGKISPSSLNSVTSNFVALLGGSKSGGRGRSKIGGKAGTRTAQRLGKFLIDIKSNGFQSAFSDIGFKFSEETKANEAINYLLEFCAGVAVTIDETAAKAAERELLEEIGGDAATFQELGEDIKEKIDEYGVEELLIKYYAYYIYEHLSIDFYEQLIEKKGRKATANFYKQLKSFLFEKLKNIARKRDLGKIDWAGKDGENVVNGIFEDTLNAFENYEG